MRLTCARGHAPQGESATPQAANSHLAWLRGWPRLAGPYAAASVTWRWCLVRNMLAEAKKPAGEFSSSRG